ncbi:MAG: hypothetical protein ACI8S3_001383 [Alphaproteobacteria bacterium]|jgi:hypothetical protein
MSRKVVFSISALLLFVEIGIGTAALKSGERQFAESRASVAAIFELVRKYSRPFPRLRTLR